MDSQTSTRVSPRTRALIPAQIETLGSTVRVDCLVRDISATGVRLETSDAVTIPQRFRLHIPKFGRRCMAELKWRVGTAVGASIADEVRTTDELRSAEEDRLEALADENRFLRRVLGAIRSNPAQAGAILEREGV